VGSPRQHRAAAETSGPSRAHDECRCRCGGLVARIVSAGVEIKCRRCKRELLVPWSARDGFVDPVERIEREAPSIEREAPLVSLPGGPS
jgi:hypothetical protein